MSENKSTALAVVDPTRAFEPNSFREAVELSKVLIASGLMPRSVGRPEAAVTIIMAGRELGLTAMQSLRAIHVVEGKPTLSADLMVALVKKLPDCEYFRLVKSTGEIATYETKRRGDPEPTTLSFTFEEAKAAGLTGKDNWRKYTAAMLRARASAALCRAVYPDAMMGIYDPDEVSEPTREPAREQVPYRVVQQPPQHEPSAPQLPEPSHDEPPPDGMRAAAKTLADRIMAATTLAELQAAAKAISEAKKSGAIDDTWVASLRQVYEVQKVKLTAKPAPAKAEPREPGDDSDEEQEVA